MPKRFGSSLSPPTARSSPACSRCGAMPSRRAGFQPAIQSVRRTRPAMGTLFEVLLLGDDEEHLTAVADAVLDEVQRIERLLSRFDPRSEISRINRLAAAESLVVDCELAGLLAACFEARHWTE